MVQFEPSRGAGGHLEVRPSREALVREARDRIPVPLAGGENRAGGGQRLRGRMLPVPPRHLVRVEECLDFPVRADTVRLERRHEGRLLRRPGGDALHVAASNQSAVGRVTMAPCVARSLSVFDPVRNIAARSSSMTARSSPTTAFAETLAASSIGFAIPAAAAPRAIPFATSRPVRTPPVATTGRP